MMVPKGSVVHFVLKSCNPVFIDDISVFSGSDKDIQFMRDALGLSSISCLPLVANQHIIGCLRLGFQEPRIWTDEEMVR